MGNPQKNIEVIFLGTGTSSSLPTIACLTAGPNASPCHTCLSTLTPEGKHNIRRNTSAVIRLPGKDGAKKTIVIDVGKNFQAAAVEWFPKYGLRRIDAVLITHAHADAMNGLDDLRAWTLKACIQPYIDVYVSKATLDAVKHAFPYMVSKEHASGGGDVPQFRWHEIEEGKPLQFWDSNMDPEDWEVEIVPFAVYHGRYFTQTPPPGYMPTPTTTGPSTPTSLSTRGSPEPEISAPPPDVFHYICHGFKVQNSVLYMADVSYIPEETWELLGRPLGQDGDALASLPQYDAVILDCLRPDTHTSHFGIVQSVHAARRLGSKRTYMVGFGHEVSHKEYVRVGETVEGKEGINATSLSLGEKKCIELLEEGKQLLGKPIWLRPAHDGLQVCVSGEGVTDSTYDGQGRSA
ncbi:beta-lactamase-like protein [Amylostereum chailletii]|nr:beta-lactamase-like protein [Amylostereum chailletii]